MEQIERGVCPLIDWAVAGAPIQGGMQSGDLHVVAAFDGGVLIGAIDGLGHGPEAAVASRAAEVILRAHASESPVRLMERCHEGLRKTRGATITLAALRSRDATMTWMGVGNVEGVLLRADASRVHEAAPLRGGVVGLRLPAPREAAVPLLRGDTLLLATDGILSGFARGLEGWVSPRDLADLILSRHRRTHDDAMVVVVRYLGSSS